MLFSSSVRKPLGPNGPPGPAILCLPYFPAFLPEAGFFAAAAVFLPEEAVLPEAGFLAAVEVLPEEAVFFLPEEEAGFLPEAVVSAGVSSPSRDARPPKRLPPPELALEEPLPPSRLPRRLTPPEELEEESSPPNREPRRAPPPLGWSCRSC